MNTYVAWPFSLYNHFTRTKSATKFFCE